MYGMEKNEVVKRYFNWIRTYHQLYGFTLIPVRDKSPLIKWGGFREKPPALADYEKWWLHDFPCAGIAVLCGTPSHGLVILDLDPRNGAAGQEYVREHVPLAAPFSCTPSGGKHFFFRTNAVVSSRIGFRKGLDVKGSSGYALLPPSVSKKGQYAWGSPWSIKDLRFPELPQMILDDLQRPVEIENNGDETERIFAEGADEGNRNIALAKLAGRYLAKGLSRGEAWVLMVAANQRFKPPLGAYEIELVLESMCKKHAERIAYANSITG